MVAGYTSVENNERKHLPVSFLHTPNFFNSCNKLLSAYLFTFGVFCGGSSLKKVSSLSQSDTNARDPSGHSPDSSDAACVANVLDGNDAVESDAESSGADAAGG